MLNLSDEKYLGKNNKYIALQYHSIYHTWKNIKSSYKDNKYKKTVPTWNDKFKLTDRLYSVSDIQDYFECFI